MEHSGGIQASLSGRYATALFELAREAKAIDMVEASLTRVRAAIDQSPEFAELIVNPIVSRGAAAKAIAASAELIDIDETTEKFLGVLAQNRRLAQLPAVIRAFRSLAAEHRGETTAEVVSAHPLSETWASVPKLAIWSLMTLEISAARISMSVAFSLSSRERENSNECGSTNRSSGSRS